MSQNIVELSVSDPGPSCPSIYSHTFKSQHFVCLVNSEDLDQADQNLYSS